MKVFLRHFFDFFSHNILFIFSSPDGKPFDRHHRSMVYQRSKNVSDTIPFGTRRDVYGSGYEFACHSMYPKVVSLVNSRVLIGNKDCKKPYSAALLNVSGMSYGALSDNAILGKPPVTLIRKNNHPIENSPKNQIFAGN